MFQALVSFSLNKLSLSFKQKSELLLMFNCLLVSPLLFNIIALRVAQSQVQRSVGLSSNQVWLLTIL